MERSVQIPRVLTMCWSRSLSCFWRCAAPSGSANDRILPQPAFFDQAVLASPRSCWRRWLERCRNGSVYSTSRWKGRCWSAPSRRWRAAISPAALPEASPLRSWPGCWRPACWHSVSAILRGNDIVIASALNLLAAGLTSFLLRSMFGVSGTFSDSAMAGLTRLHIRRGQSAGRRTRVGGNRTARLRLVAACRAGRGVLAYTPWGLRIRGVGEQADAAVTLEPTPSGIASASRSRAARCAAWRGCNCRWAASPVQ